MFHVKMQNMISTVEFKVHQTHIHIEHYLENDYIEEVNREEFDNNFDFNEITTDSNEIN